MSAADTPHPAAGRRPAGSDAATGRRRGSRLWWWVVAAFALQFAVWTAWLIFAAHQEIQDVPLATQGSEAD